MGAFKGGAQQRAPKSAYQATAVSVGGGDQTLATAARGIYVGGAGNLVCRLTGDTADVTFTGLLAGNWYPFAIEIVRQTNTTITNSVLLF